tara:strand:+ start:708 stop:827 length:120 start_codon:yes stop_codon:yes gene_type:complete
MIKLKQILFILLLFSFGCATTKTAEKCEKIEKKECCSKK